MAFLGAPTINPGVDDAAGTVADRTDSPTIGVGLPLLLVVEDVSPSIRELDG